MENWNPIETLIENAAIREHNEEVAATTVLSYWHDLNAVEKRFAQVKPRPELSEVIAAQKDVYAKYWKESDDHYWEPCSYSSDEDYRLEDIAEVHVMTDYRTTFIVRLVIRKDSKRPGKTDMCYELQTEDGSDNGRLVIVNEFH